MLLVFMFQIASFEIASAYSLDGSSGSAQSIFDKNPLQFRPINLDRFISPEPFGLTFNDLINTKSFSFQDIGASLKAVVILFIKLIVTTLNVTLGILRALLGVLT